MLMKQSPSAVDLLQRVFNLSDGEKGYLLSCDKGQGLFFAGSNHVGIQVISSVAEHELITSDPRDLEKLKAREGQEDTRTIEELAQIYDAPTTQQPTRDSKPGREDELISEAVERRERQKGMLEKEREAYQQELERKLQEQEKIMNPEKFAKQKTFLDELNENTLTGQVVNQRKETLKGRRHLTPQGMVQSYPNEEEDNENV